MKIDLVPKMYRTVPVPNGFGTVRYQGPKSPYRTDTEPKKKNKFGIGMTSIPDHTVPVPALSMTILGWHRIGDGESETQISFIVS